MTKHRIIAPVIGFILALFLVLAGVHLLSVASPPTSPEPPIVIAGDEARVDPDVDTSAIVPEAPVEPSALVLPDLPPAPALASELTPPAATVARPVVRPRQRLPPRRRFVRLIQVVQDWRETILQASFR